MACSLTGCGSGAEEEADAPPAESGNEQSSVSAGPIELVAGQIPEGYPEREILLYDLSSSVILGGHRLDVDGVLHCNVVLGSGDDMQTITKDIKNKIENDSTEFEDLGGGMLIGAKGGWEYVITMGSGEVDGYETTVTYTLTEEK